MRLKRLAVGAAAVVVSTAALTLPALAASNNIIVTYAGTGQQGYSGDNGQATAAQLNSPTGVVLDNSSHIFFSDTGNQRIRKVDKGTGGGAGGVITTVAGNGTAGYSGDGGPATAAKVNTPTGIVVTSGGNIYFADTGNNVVREISGGVITTVAGIRYSTGAQNAGGAMMGGNNQDCKDHGDNGPATSAYLCFPTGVAVDSAGNLYIGDTGNNKVRKVTSSGTITTFAGTGVCGFNGNTGPAGNAKLCAPTAVATSGSAVLISDTANSQVRKVSGGTITAFAGTGSAGFSGDGGQATAAQINRPIGVSYDPLGNVYVVDAFNARLRQVDASGHITTFAGTGQFGYSGDGGPAELAKIAAFGGVTTDASNVFFGDTANHRVRRIHKGGPPPALPEARNIFLAGSAVLLLGGAVFLSFRARKRSTAPLAA
jgi:hypothetical protein